MEPEVEFIDEKKELAKEQKKDRRSLREILDGTVTTEIISRNLRFIVFIAFIAMLYIANRYHAEKLAREMSTLQAEVKELNAEAISAAAELMFISKQSEVIKLIEEKQLGLKEAVVPPVKIIVKNRDLR